MSWEWVVVITVLCFSIVALFLIAALDNKWKGVK